MKKLVLLVLVWASASALAFDPDGAVFWIERLSTTVKDYQKDAAGATTPNFSTFLRSVSDLDYYAQNLKPYLSQGYDRSSPSIQQLKRHWEEIRRNYESTYGNDPSPAVRLGWNNIHLAFLELDFALLKEPGPLGTRRTSRATRSSR